MLTRHCTVFGVCSTNAAWQVWRHILYQPTVKASAFDLGYGNISREAEEEEEEKPPAFGNMNGGRKIRKNSYSVVEIALCSSIVRGNPLPQASLLRVQANWKQRGAAIKHTEYIYFKNRSQ